TSSTWAEPPSPCPDEPPTVPPHPGFGRPPPPPFIQRNFTRHCRKTHDTHHTAGQRDSGHAGAWRAIDILLWSYCSSTAFTRNCLNCKQSRVWGTARGAVRPEAKRDVNHTAFSVELGASRSRAGA